MGNQRRGQKISKKKKGEVLQVKNPLLPHSGFQKQELQLSGGSQEGPAVITGGAAGEGQRAHPAPAQHTEPILGTAA